MLRWIAPFGAAILIIGWNRELEDWQVALSFTAALLVAMLLQATAPKNKDLESNKDNVVSLDEFRRQRHGSAFEENLARLQNVFETQYLHEAEMMASMLESEGIPTHLFNRHNALSLIHISEPTRLRCISYAVFCLKKKTHLRTNLYHTVI